jgi:hypothetical protein
MAGNGKKGRGTLASAGNNSQQAVQQGQQLYNQGEGIANSEINTNGGLSPLVSKQLANEQGMIGKAYAGASQAADRGLAQRGMGSAPSGLSASIKNTAINNQGTADTGAVGNAFGTQNQLNNGALNQATNALGAETGAVNAQTNAGTALNKAGSTMGDVLSGIQGLAGSAGSVMSGMGGI